MRDLSGDGRRLVALLVVAVVVGIWSLSADYGGGDVADEERAALASTCEPAVEIRDRIRYMAGFDYYLSDAGLGRC